MSEAEAKKRKPRKAKPTQVELRLMAGATILKTTNQDAPRGAFWTFLDTGRAARADIVEKLIEAGKLKPRNDGLFGGDGQTWALSKLEGL
jgi:hypothetical protein